jgi:hypothetical protein
VLFPELSDLFFEVFVFALQFVHLLFYRSQHLANFFFCEARNIERKNDGCAASRISSNLNENSKQFGWLCPIRARILSQPS